MGNILWIASYPKSGNTWFRMFLSHILRDEISSIDINQYESDGIASARNAFDYYSGLDSTDLTREEIERLRPDVYEKMSATAEGLLIIKAHDAYKTLPDGRHLFPSPATKAAVYLLRNPLDVLVSYAHHNGQSIEKTIKAMNNADHTLSYKKNNALSQLPHFLGTWSHHVQSWTEIPSFTYVIRYEDLHQKPLDTFKKAAEAIGLNKSTERIKKAIEATSFDNLQKQEQEKGFHERPHSSSSFFRSGKLGSWRESLTEKQAGAIIEKHSVMMKRYGYLDHKDNPVY